MHRETMNLTCVISILKDARATSGSPHVAFKDEGLAGDVCGCGEVGKQKSKPRDQSGPVNRDSFGPQVSWQLFPA